MIDINDELLLRKIIMNHFTNPNNKGIKNINNAIVEHAKSVTCADEMDIEIYFEQKVLKQIYFEGTACAIATASADIFFDLILFKNKDEILNIIDVFQDFLNTGNLENIELLDELIVFKNIYKQRNRILCANLAIESIKKVLNNI